MLVKGACDVTVPGGAVEGGAQNDLKGRKTILFSREGSSQWCRFSLPLRVRLRLDAWDCFTELHGQPPFCRSRAIARSIRSSSSNSRHIKWQVWWRLWHLWREQYEGWSHYILLSSAATLQSSPPWMCNHYHHWYVMWYTSLGQSRNKFFS